MTPLYGGIEAGGTKFLCVVGSGPDDIRRRRRIATTTPDETLPAVVEFLAEATADLGQPLSAIGVASFGPLELRRDQPGWGRITATPKPGWSGTDLVTPLVTSFHVPVAIDTDVNGAALAEWRWGAGRGTGCLVYVTVGTGIGGGGVVDGRPLHGLVHPEMGHVQVRRVEGDTFPGACPFHGDCWEGMASGPAMEARWGAPAEQLGDRAEAVDLEARYLAAGLRQVVYVLAPERIVMGGGVTELPGLRPAAWRALLDEMGGYGPLAGEDEGYLTAPGLGAMAGAAGALALAESVAGPAEGGPLRGPV